MVKWLTFRKTSDTLEALLFGFRKNISKNISKVQCTRVNRYVKFSKPFIKNIPSDLLRLWIIIIVIISTVVIDIIIAITFHFFWK